MKMARSKDGDGVKSALIIAEVQKRPILYDANHQSYGVRALKMQNWEEVCAAVLPEWASMGSAEKHVLGKEIQKRWRSIRDSYTKAYRQGKCALPSALPPGGGRRSQHQRQMSFLYRALQQKISRPSTDKRSTETEPASPQADPSLTVVKQKERNKQEKDNTKQDKLKIQLEKENVKHLKENNKQGKENNKQQKDKKQQKVSNHEELTENKVETRLPSIDTASTDGDKLIELKAILLEPKPVENTEMKNIIEANLQELKNVNEERTMIDRNPSLEIKIDANTILPEDHFDDDRLFMNSLLPFFKKMDDNTRLTCRIEVLKIIKYALQVQTKQNFMQNNVETGRRSEETTVKDEVLTRPDTSDSVVEKTPVSTPTSLAEEVKTKADASDSGVEETPISIATSLRMCRKRKASSPPAQSDQPEIRRKGPGRPRKDVYNVKIKKKACFEAWLDVEEARKEHENSLHLVQRYERARKRAEARRTRGELTPGEEGEISQQFLKEDYIMMTERDWRECLKEAEDKYAHLTQELERAKQARERDEARKHEGERTRDQLTPDDEEMYSVTQLKPPQFLKNDGRITAPRARWFEDAEEAERSRTLREVQRAQRARKRNEARKYTEARTQDRLTSDEEEMYRATSVTQLKPPQFLKMYNLKPAKKSPVTPAISLPGAAANKQS